MLGLPSTTEVDKRLPKEAFYKNLKISPAVKESFVHDIESISVANSVKASTANIEDGEAVHEILVMRVDLKGRKVPIAALEAIDSANNAKKVFACVFEGERCLAAKVGKLVVGPWMPEGEIRIEVNSGSLDNLWDTLASQVVYGDTGSEDHTVEERYARDQKIEALRKEIGKVDTRCRKERQPGKKNELFAKVKKLKAELAELEKGM